MIKNFSSSSFVAGIITGALLAGAWLLNNGPDISPASQSALISNMGENTVPDSGAVSVDDQPSGSEVVVESVTVPPPGVWVAIHELNGGELGNILGATLVSWPRSNVSVQLLRETQSGRQYAVQLYRDDGSGTFDLSTDSVYVDFDTGSRVVAHFKTTE
jgi:hypothetical protein